MEQNLKQRLVGALVLISLAVIFLPLVFDGQQQRIDTTPYTIPEKPVITITAPDVAPLEEAAKTQYREIAEVAAAKQAQDDASATMMTSDPPSDAAEVSVPEEPAAASSQQTAKYLEQEKAVDDGLKGKPVSTTVPLSDAWVIQVGAFSSEANAKGLQAKLSSAGYPAFVKGTKSAGATLYKVYVGPEIRRAQMDRQKIELERKYNLKTLILKYIP